MDKLNAILSDNASAKRFISLVSMVLLPILNNKFHLELSQDMVQELVGGILFFIGMSNWKEVSLARIESAKVEALKAPVSPSSAVDTLNNLGKVLLLLALAGLCAPSTSFASEPVTVPTGFSVPAELDSPCTLPDAMHADRPCLLDSGGMYLPKGIVASTKATLLPLGAAYLPKPILEATEKQIKGCEAALTQAKTEIKTAPTVPIGIVIVIGVVAAGVGVAVGAGIVEAIKGSKPAPAS